MNRKGNDTGRKNRNQNRKKSQEKYGKYNSKSIRIEQNKQENSDKKKPVVKKQR